MKSVALFPSVFSHPQTQGLPLFFYASSVGTSETPFFVFGSDKTISEFSKNLDLLSQEYEFFPSGTDQQDESLQLAYIFRLLRNMAGQVTLFPTSTFSSSLPSPKEFNDSIFTLSVDSEHTVKQLTEKLIEFGFRRESAVYEQGGFSVKGDVVDVFPFHSTNPVRISFSFTSIESISYFNVSKRTSLESISSFEFIPLSFDNKSGSLLEYLPFVISDETVSSLVLDPDTISLDIDPLHEGVFNMFTTYLRKSAAMYVWHDSPDTEGYFHSYETKDVPAYYLHPASFFSFLSDSSNNMTQILFTHKRESVSNILDNEAVSYAFESFENIPTILEQLEKKLFVIECPQSISLSFAGFSVEELDVSVLTDTDMFAQKIRRKAKKADEAFIAELNEGDFVVHIDHGVGKFIGMTTREMNGITREYFLLEYAKGDKIYLPVEYAEKIAKYIGSASPRVNRLHEVSFKQIKGRIKEDTRKIAKELLEVQATRNARKGLVFEESPRESDFIDAFLYDETESQVMVWEEIASDLGKGLPMDRLVCGDVGFGKTEMAMRTAFRVADLGYQVTVLAPTTILAKQHFETFMERFSDFPDISIAMLSRLQTDKEQAEIISQAAKGEISIVVGTHRLLSKDVSFKDLGLIVIDEEQRFGVKHKEKLKKLRDKVDILTITATPIPRTLHMGLAGLKQISTLTTPPPGRVPIQTIVGPYDTALVSRAVIDETARKGQVYYLHNRVQTIGAAKQKLEQLLPDYSFGIVHGQLPPKQIAQTMKNFADKKIDVLVASSIIENGIDIPNANTLVVADATRFGLGQLYQLRGRIGRSLQKGYAYLLYPEQKLTELAKKRLTALKKAQKLGSGFELAMKDLEMRGAGNILGKEQSGKVEAIGLTHYLNLLNEAVRELQTGVVVKEIDVSIELPLDARIPSELVDDESERLHLYQSIASIDSLQDLTKKQDELMQDIDSTELSDLFFVLRLKLRAKLAEITGIQVKKFLNPDETQYERVVISFDEKADYEVAYSLLKKYPFIEIEEDALKMDFEMLGTNWRVKLEDIVSYFSK